MDAMRNPGCLSATTLIVLALLPLAASAQDKRPCDPVWAEILIAREKALSDCANAGGSCQKEFTERDEAFNKAGDCPPKAATPSAAAATPPPSVAAPAEPPAPMSSGGGGNSNDFLMGNAQGRLDAQNHTPIGWGVCGFAGGFLCGPIGCLGTTGIAYLPNPDAPGGGRNSAEWTRGYNGGYRDKVKSKRAVTALIGGTVGVLISLPIILYYNAQQAKNDDTQNFTAIGLRF